MVRNVHYQAFYRLLFQFFIILTIGLSASIASFIQAQKLVSRNMEQESLTALATSARLFHQRIDELNHTAAQIGDDRWVRIFYNFQDDIPVSNIWKLNEVQKMLSVFPDINDLIYDNFIYYHSSGIFVSSGLAATGPDTYYGGPFYYSDFDYSNWCDLVSSHELDGSFRGENIFLDAADEENYYVYYRMIPSTGVSGPKATLAFLLSRYEVEKLFAQFDVLPLGIYDREGHTPFYINQAMAGRDAKPLHRERQSEGSEIKTLASGDRIITVRSEYFTYVLILEKKMMRLSLASVRTIYFMIMGFAFVPGVLLAFYLSYRRSQPIKNIISQLAASLEINPGDVQINLEFIQSNLDSLVREKSLLENNLEKQLPLLRAAFLEKVIRGEMKDENEMKQAADGLGIDFGGRYHFIILIGVQMDPQIREAYFDNLHTIGMVLDLISSLPCTRSAHIHFGNSLTALVCHARCSYEEYFDLAQQSISDLMTEINREIPGELRIGVGRFYTSLSDLVRSYEEAVQIHHFWLSFGEETLSWYQRLPAQEQDHQLYNFDENHLVQLVFLNKQEEYEFLIKRQVREALIREKSLKGRESLMNDIHRIMRRIYNQLPFPDDSMDRRLGMMLDHMMIFSSYDEWQRRILDYLNLASLLLQSSRRSRNYELRDKIISDLEENYFDPNICLALYAQKYRITEQYLSQFIKEQTGLGFSAYLERIRMENIVRELDSTGDSIMQISLRCGYANKNTFYKAFKRIYGLSPREYRAHLKREG